MQGRTDYLETSDEDCLYLNVYTKEISPEKCRPVLVWIHGGGFGLGSGNTDMYGPDYFMKKDVVLVTINYRLGVLGFLSLQDESCPGNNGLRDMLEALRWVQRNISAFGGDKNNVTIFGESAGGAAVQFLMLSRQSQGLFHRAISQSGSAMNPWAISRQPLRIAFALGEALGFHTEDRKSLLEFLKKASAKDIVENSGRIIRNVEPHLFYMDLAFVPCVEPKSSDAIICTNPEELLRNGEFLDIPYMLGILTLEGAIMVKPGQATAELKTKKELERLLPPHVVPGTSTADSVLEKIKNFYFPNGFDKQKYFDILTWVYFAAGNEIALRGLSEATNRKSNTYSYEFTHEDGLGIFRAMWALDDVKGTFHGDELPYLFYSNMFPSEPSSTDAKVIDTMIQLWTDFALHGNPTPDNKAWKPYTKDDKSYMDLGAKIELKRNRKQDEVDFWLSILDEIRERAVPKL